MLFRLDLGQITFNSVKNALVSQQLGFLATSVAMCDVLTRARAEIKILVQPGVVAANLGGHYLGITGKIFFSLRS